MVMKDDVNFNKKKKKKEIDEMVLFDWSEPTCPIQKEDVTVEFSTI